MQILAKGSRVLAAAASIVLLWGSWADAQTLVGGRIGTYLDREDLFIGGEVLTPIEGSFYFNPNVEYVFVDRGDFATFNFDFHYDFARRGSAFFWAGAGLGILYFSPEGPRGSDTNFGANILLGVGFRTAGRLIPYVQAKVIAADDSDFSIGFGLRF